MTQSVLNRIWNAITKEGHLKGLTRAPQLSIFVIKNYQTNPRLAIMTSKEFFEEANGDLFIGRELPSRDTLIELVREHREFS